jgi:hypothetical protein
MLNKQFTCLTLFSQIDQPGLAWRTKVRKEFRWLTNTISSPFRLEPFSNHRADFLSVLGVFAVQLPFLG